MSKVITFSRHFPSYHPRKGEQTNFVEKIWKGFMDEIFGLPKPFHNYVDNYTKLLNGIKPIDLMSKYWEVEPKHHTIRAGNRWEVGDYFSPRVWSGKPYKSKQITIAPDIEVKKVWNFQFNPSLWTDESKIYIDNKTINSKIFIELANNDGLKPMDFIEWFGDGTLASTKKKAFQGQIICWNENINY